MTLKAFSTPYFKQLQIMRKKNIIFFNGCFDIIHPGHLKLINRVKSIKNKYKPDSAIIICGINSDESVKKQNKKHPLVNDENERAKFLEMLGIDCVIVFDEENPLSLLMSLMPDEVITTSSYYNSINDDIVFCKNHNIKIDYITFELGYSTTGTYDKIEQQVKEKIINEIKA